MPKKPEVVVIEAQPKKQLKDNTIYSRTSEELFKKVYAASMHTGFSMSEIVRLCLEKSLDSVTYDLMRVRKG